MTHLKFIALVAIVAGSAAAGQGQERVPARELDALVKLAMATGLSPGLGVAVVVGDKPVYVKGFGFADRETGRRVTGDTQFYIASTTKSLTALAGAILASRGVIDLDAPIVKYLPDARFHPRLDPATVSVRSLLTHTHGIRPAGPIDVRTAFTGDFSQQQLLSLLTFHPPAPTRDFAYSNVGYNIFGMMLEGRSLGGWKTVLEREVLIPVGMRRTTAFISRTKPDQLAMPYELDFDRDRPERIPFVKRDETMQAAGGHVSTPRDLARYLIVHVNTGNIDGKQVISASAIESTHRREVVQSRRFGEFQRFGWSLGWDMATYQGETILQRYGSFPGFHSHVSFMPDRKIGVVVLSNGGIAGSAVAEAVAAGIYDRLLGRSASSADFAQRLEQQKTNLRSALEKDQATRRARQQATLLPLAAYAGAYESPALGRMVWSFAEGHLEVRLGIASSSAEVYEGPKHQFRVELTGPSVATFRVPDGARRPSGLVFLDFDFERVAD